MLCRSSSITAIAIVIITIATIITIITTITISIIIGRQWGGAGGLGQTEAD